jgi:pimeloyl-ACP methyl ester carboxylesterase
MTADPGRSGPAWGRRRRGGPRQVIPVRLRRVGPAERIQMLTVGGRVLRVATRDGNPGRPPMLLCNGIGGRLELFQPFVDVLDPRRAIIRFDMPGIGESPAPVVPYHLATLAPLLTGLLDQLGVARADVLGISWGGAGLLLPAHLRHRLDQHSPAAQAAAAHADPGR